jgi:hypothetical protein
VGTGRKRESALSGSGCEFWRDLNRSHPPGIRSARERPDVPGRRARVHRRGRLGRRKGRACARSHLGAHRRRPFPLARTVSFEAGEASGAAPRLVCGDAPSLQRRQRSCRSSGTRCTPRCCTSITRPRHAASTREYPRYRSVKPWYSRVRPQYPQIPQYPHYPLSTPVPLSTPSTPTTPKYPPHRRYFQHPKPHTPPVRVQVQLHLDNLTCTPAFVGWFETALKLKPQIWDRVRPSFLPREYSAVPRGRQPAVPRQRCAAYGAAVG